MTIILKDIITAPNRGWYHIIYTNNKNNQKLINI